MSILGALLLTMNFQISYGQSDFILWEDTRKAYTLHQFITPESNIELKLGLSYIGGGVSIPTVRDQDARHLVGGFDPLQGAFTFCGGLKNKWIDVGYTYSCHHPFFTYLDGDAYNKVVKSRVEGGVWKVFVKVQGEFHPFK